MSQDKIKGDIVFICDDCDDTLETETSDFEEANDIRIDSGWRAFRDHSNWMHVCPDCG